MMANLYAAWIGFLLGAVAGIVPGLFFHRENWLGGYASWPRRMIRLGHISFFGIGLLNLAAALTADRLDLRSGLGAASGALLVGAVAMPAVCYLSAWRQMFRHLFFIPASAVALGVAAFLWRLLLR
jgi:hypothetical protein